MRKLAATLSLGLLVSAAASADAPVANVLDNGLSLNGISMNGLLSDGLAAGTALGELNGVVVQAVILPAVVR